MSQTKTVLIVEDDPVFRRVLSFSIAKKGMIVETANHGGSGFDRLMNGGIDFLVTDLQMPLCSGIELLERLQAVKGYQCPSTVLCTAKGLELDRNDLIERFNLLALMHKPFSPRKLTEVIINHFEEVAGVVDKDQEATEMITPTFAMNPIALQADVGHHG
ncbi:response regulator [Planctomycetes bacterium K23_9]|uniref:Chemotaxis protein CheY n=1 Tax=Stieleria marina TaxID=1930275 RepID=A0A517NSB7_9BACT|nr:Chemotaxis protein CheY [Planctomycetes bacterium K23_9]